MTTLLIGGEPTSFEFLTLAGIYTDLQITNRILEGTMMLDPAADSALTHSGILFNVQVDSGVGVNDKDIFEVNAIDVTVSHAGLGTIDIMAGVKGTIAPGSGLNALVTEGACFEAIVINSGTLTNGYGFLALAPVNNFTLTSYTAFYSKEITTGTNPHYCWFDSDGVLDIREAGQAIVSLHNPGITKFTSGSANFERSVQQWTSHVLQLGAEAGGTGTLRKVELLGAGVFLKSGILPTSDPGVPGQLYRIAGAVMVSL